VLRPIHVEDQWKNELQCKSNTTKTVSIYRSRTLDVFLYAAGFLVINGALGYG